ncbi:DUF4861 family protein [Spirosoma sp. KUDC1026]|uniref:DUF4861 family protein n=1 Tax=Spirosoma sp. KUDC1026 TaxID=2745947 RepID=UPI00159B8BA5|nr:DUF4861 family protein [Spirosoma sp. KUDC1026]QKZ13504.1 DUF4861 family protein [Spirosoma sp. KUDC1026]
MKFVLFAWMLGLSGSLLAQSSAPIQVTNPSNTSLTQTVVEIPWATILKAYPQVDTSQLIVQTSDGQEVPYQLEHRGKKPVQNLLVQLSLAPKQSVQLMLRKGTPTPVKAKTYCRYVPERYDDFAWENDNVAFRIYGAALNGRSDNAYGTDIWAKRTNELVLDKWYKQDDYHKDHGEGLDYYHVGLTLGAGNIGVFLNDSIQFVHNYRSWEILDNGPLRSTFRVTFDPYTFKGITVKEVRTVSLDVGAQLSKVQVHIEHTSPKPLPMVVGISLRSEPSPLLQDEKNGIMGYWEPKHGNDGTIGVGCVFPKAPVSMLRKYDHALARLTAKPSDDLIYYTGGAWDKAGRITSSADWFAYLRQIAAQQKQPLRITVLPKKAGN